MMTQHDATFITTLYKCSYRILITCAVVALGVTAGAAEEEVEGIEEVIVTAQKREQSHGDVGIAVTTFTGSKIRELGLNQPTDLAAQTPNLNINSTFENSVTNISIRGVGLNDYAVNNNPAAGIYVDDIYLVSPAMLTFQLFDLERVEILKGPQGTLYGRNTTAGTVNFISRSPTEEFEANISAGLGNYKSSVFEGAISGELSPGLTGRIALHTIRNGEGHQTNRATGNDVGEISRTSWRGIIDWQLSSQVDARLNIHGGRDQSDTWLIKVDNMFTEEDDEFYPGDPYSSSGHPDTLLDTKSQGVSLRINWNLSDQLSLVSVTGYEDFSRNHQEDRDGTTLIQLDAEYINDITQLSEEIRLNYIGANLLAVVGVFFENDEVSTRDRFDAPALPFPFLSVGNEYVQETDSYAVFAHTEWTLSDDWNMTIGLRYSNEEKEFRDAFTFLFVDALPRDGGTEVQAFPSVSNDYEVENVSGKVGFDYTGFTNTLWYFHVSRGFKSGNFQGQLTFDPTTLENFDSETLIAYEVGFKSRLMDNRLHINGSAFMYDYEDIQVYGPLFDSPVGPLFGIDNVGDAEVAGAEIELLWRPADGFDIGLGLGLLDTEIVKSILPTIAEGSELPNAPEMNFSLLASYQWNVGGNLKAKIIVDTSYKDGVTYDIVRAPAEAVEGGYWLSNLHIGIGSSDGTWEARIWCKNLGDKQYRSQVLNSTVGFGETYGLPRTYGITLDYNW